MRTVKTKSRYGNVRRIALVMVVLGVAAYGAYHFVLSSAATRVSVTLPLPGGPGPIGGDNAVHVLPDGGMDIIVNVPEMTDAPAQAMSVTLAVFGNNANNLSDNQTARDGRPHVFTFTRLAAGSGFEPDADYSQAAASIRSSASVAMFDACYNISQNRFGARNVLLGTLFMNLDYPYDDPRYPDQGGYISVDAYFAKGTCAQQLSHTSPGIYGHTGYAQLTIGGAHDSGAITGNTGSGQGLSGDGSGVSGSGSSSGSGGSSAVKQGTTNNTVPSTSAQGVKNAQSAVQPSPFYDGKEYAPGSDERLLGAKTASSILRQTKMRWPYILCAAAIVAFGGYMYLRIRRQHRGSVKRKK
jgi:uncharacterized membrane protein YgcG